MSASKSFMASVAFLVSAAGADAAVYYPTQVSAEYGLCKGKTHFCEANDRKTVSNAIDDDASTFYSLGFGGSILLRFAMPMTEVAKTILISEVTFGRIGNHKEAADVYAINGKDETFLGRITNLFGESQIFTNASFEFLKLVDVTQVQFASTTSHDGFDVGKVSIAAVPLPASAALMLAGIGTLATLRRRKKAA